jgi:uncharacterized protein
MIVRALGLLVLAATSAHAGASFDCSKAATPVEQAICADPALADLDGKVAAAYTSALQKLAADPKRRAELAAAQRRFIAQRNSAFGQPGFSLSGQLSQRLAQLQAATPRSAAARVDINTYVQLVPTEVFDDATDGLDPEQRDTVLRKGKNDDWIFKRVHAGKATLTAVHPTSIVTMTVMDVGDQVLEVHIQNEKNLTTSYWIFRSPKEPLERYHPRLALRAAAAARHLTGRADAETSPGPVNPLSGVPAEIVAHVDAIAACGSSASQPKRGDGMTDPTADPKTPGCGSLDATEAALRRIYAADSLAAVTLDQARQMLTQ